MCLPVVITLILCFTPTAQAIEVSDQHWAAEVKGGFFFPTDDSMSRFFGGCCNGYYEVRAGYLFDSRIQFDVGVGFFYEKASAIGSVTGTPSGEKFTFMLVPISNSITYRFDYIENQVLVPYVGAGIDYMFYRERLMGNSTTGWKFGYHADAGLQISLEWFDSANNAMEEMGINDVYFTVEGRWTHINNFGSAGLNVAGFSTLMGLLFEF